MCFHKRILYRCGHESWGAEIAKCNHQRAFEEASWPISCPDMFAHPFHTLKLQKQCIKCKQKIARATQVADTLSRVKLAMAELNKTVQKLQ